MLIRQMVNKLPFQGTPKLRIPFVNLSESNWVYERSVTGFESSRQGCESWRVKAPLPTVAQKARNNHKKYNIKFAYIKNCKFTLFFNVWSNSQ